MILIGLERTFTQKMFYYRENDEECLENESWVKLGVVLNTGQKCSPDSIVTMNILEMCAYSQIRLIPIKDVHPTV